MIKPALHILSLPHTQLTDSYVSCAYTSKALKLARMMDSLGYEVYLYGSEDFELMATKVTPVTCITKSQQQELLGYNDHKKHFYNITWEPKDDIWQLFNRNAIKEIRKNISERDLILTFAGVCQKQVADAFPANMTVEAGIGYTGVFSKYKVFESNTWEAYVAGLAGNDNGHFYDTVINNYWDVEEFPFAEERGDYYLYVGRLIYRKGYQIAQQVCEKLGKRLILAGQMEKGQEFSGYGEYIGTINAKERGKLMSEAIALFTPTRYRGPFEGVHAEALLCGTPVITTNFGVFTETVVNGENGMRCNNFREFMGAARWAEGVDTEERRKIRENAISRWGMDVVKHEYDDYFTRLMDLYGDGWYAE